MREREQYRLAAQAGKRELLLLRQFQFLQLRQEALERAESLTPAWTRVKWFFNPSAKYAVVDAIQKALMDKHNTEAAKVAEAAKAEAARPKIQIVGALP